MSDTDWTVIREGYEQGISLRDLAGQYGSSKSAICRRAASEGWQREDAAQQARQDVVRQELRTSLLEKAVDLLDRMDEPHIDFRGKDVEKVTFPRATSGDVRSYAIAVGVLIDKFRLEMGEATSRDESVSPEERRQRIREWRDELAARRAS